MPGKIVKASFTPPVWLRNPHVQTLWPRFFRTRPEVNGETRRWETPDGDFLDLVFTPAFDDQHIPIVLILHGLGGSIQSKYAAGLMLALQQRGLRAVLMHFRGCSTELNRLPRCYHSGETSDPLWVLQRLHAQYPDVSIGLCGFSLGGNATLKLLGETGTDYYWLKAAAAVSVPFQLDACATRLNQGFSRVYEWYLVRELRQVQLAKSAQMDIGIAPAAINSCRTFKQFDDVVTAGLHGFENGDDYYQQSSSRQYLKRINKPTLILQAADDPFLLPTAIPTEHELADKVQLELAEYGGHVGFVSNDKQQPYWLESRLSCFFSEKL